MLVVDELPVYRDGIAAWIARCPSLSLLGGAGSGREALSMLERLRPDVMVLDWEIPRLDGAAVLGAAASGRPPTRVVVLFSDQDVGAPHAALEAGAAAVLARSSGGQEICDAIVAAGSGRTVLDPRAQGALGHELRRRRRLEDPDLSVRETEVLHQVASGRSTREIAAALAVEQSTIKTHVARVMEKLAVNDRAQAVAEATRRGLLE